MMISRKLRATFIDVVSYYADLVHCTAAVLASVVVTFQGNAAIVFVLTKIAHVMGMMRAHVPAMANAIAERQTRCRQI